MGLDNQQLAGELTAMMGNSTSSSPAPARPRGFPLAQVALTAAPCS